jgi:uncharacterized protein YdeI (YjbR/CyaY-like superfamily)
LERDQYQARSGANERKANATSGVESVRGATRKQVGIYSYEQRRADLEEPYSNQFKKNKTAWNFFQAQPPSYRKMIGWWIISAKKEETRSERLKKLMKASAEGKRL